ncbi:uncharacterized protein ATNIH1004_009496 [Aspergillus tanneri]|uniref:Uncharacterized protein n=1 Tax=Aspergillus tanneri TaxID=1220188 RepID=A0A5M9MBT7_9EURO|nr:uncharacterized protein ATNIH1004_009496 [Aspergillus tanneri]KAA8642744.1 hypothetical protein ATNIH1004_009496 [Aspergillus tanneri]
MLSHAARRIPQIPTCLAVRKACTAWVTDLLQPASNGRSAIFERRLHRPGNAGSCMYNPVWRPRSCIPSVFLLPRSRSLGLLRPARQWNYRLWQTHDDQFPGPPPSKLATIAYISTDGTPSYATTAVTAAGNNATVTTTSSSSSSGIGVGIAAGIGVGVRLGVYYCSGYRIIVLSESEAKRRSSSWYTSWERQSLDPGSSIRANRMHSISSLSEYSIDIGAFTSYAVNCFSVSASHNAVTLESLLPLSFEVMLDMEMFWRRPKWKGKNSCRLMRQSFWRELIGNLIGVSIMCYAACVMTCLWEIGVLYSVSISIALDLIAVFIADESRTRHNMFRCNCCLFPVAKFLIDSRWKGVAAAGIVVSQLRWQNCIW